MTFAVEIRMGRGSRKGCILGPWWAMATAWLRIGRTWPMWLMVLNDRYVNAHTGSGTKAPPTGQRYGLARCTPDVDVRHCLLTYSPMSGSMTPPQQ
jgi:hypothetical protein